MRDDDADDDADAERLWYFSVFNFISNLENMNNWIMRLLLT